MDKLDVINIRKNADKLITVNTAVSYGQAVFNAAHKLFPKETEVLRNTSYDCYYHDDRVELFLSQLLKVE